MRPVDYQAKSDEALLKLRVCLQQEDIDWLSGLGMIENLLLDEIPGSGRKKRYPAHVTCRPLSQLNFRWGVARLRVDLGDFAARAPLRDDFRTFVERLLNEARSCEQQLSADLVADYFDRFHTLTADDPCALYDDVTSEQLLKEVAGVTILVLCSGEHTTAQAWFSVPWDDEHGVELPIKLDEILELRSISATLTPWSPLFVVVVAGVAFLYWAFHSA